MYRTVVFLVILALPFTRILGQEGAPLLGCAPLVVNFTAPEGSDSWFWNFRDNAVSFLENPSHLFALPGVYEVELRETTEGAVLGIVTVTVLPRPQLSIAATPDNVCPGASVSFLDVTAYHPDMQPVQRLWTFGDGGNSLQAAPQHAYALPGLYTISLEVNPALPGCANTQVFPQRVEVWQPPKVSFATDPDPPTACEAPLTVTFTNTASGVQPLQYLWEYGSGQTFIGLHLPPQQYLAAGSYPVKLTVTDARGCIDTFRLNPGIGVDFFDISIPPIRCLGDTIEVVNNVPTGVHLWDFGTAANTQYSIQRSPKIVFLETGVYPVHYKWSDVTKTCHLDTIFFVYIENPVIDFMSIIPDHCAAPVTVTMVPNYQGGRYFWQFGKYGTSTDLSPSFTYPKDTKSLSIAGPRVIRTTLYFESAGGCRDTLVKADTLHITTAALAADNYKGCAPHEVQFLDWSYARSGIVRWTWFFGDGNTYTTTTPGDVPAHVYDTCGIYNAWLIVEDAEGCIDTSYQLPFTICGCEPTPGSPGSGPIIIVEPSDIYGFPTDTICLDGKMIFIIKKTPNFKYIRFEGDGFRLWHCSTAKDGEDIVVNWSFLREPGTHIISRTVVDHLGEEFVIDTFLIFHIKGAWARANYQTNCEDPYTVRYVDSSMNATRILWELPDGTTSDALELDHTFASTGDYWVRLTAWDDVSGCPPSTDSVMVCIRDPKAAFALPSFGCKGAPVHLDASESVDVNAVCHKGYKWLFSGGMRPRVLDDPRDTILFDVACEQSITLVVSDVNGCTDTFTRTINIEEIDAQFELENDTYCLPAFFAPQPKITTNCAVFSEAQWTFGNDVVTGTNPSYTFEKGSAMVDSLVFVTLTAFSANGCAFMHTDSFLVYAPKSRIHVFPNPPSICRFGSIEFSADEYTASGSHLLFDWDFGNGQTGTGQQVVATYPDTGLFTVVLHFEEAHSGCSEQLSLPVEVQDPPDVVYTTSADTLDILCHPLTIRFLTESDTSGLNFFWDFGNGQTSSLPTPATVYGKGAYTATLTVSSSIGCADTLRWDFVLEGPEGNFTFDKTGICLGEPLTLSLSDTLEVAGWTWDMGDGTLIANENPVTHTYTHLPDTGVWIIQLLLLDPNEKCPFIVTHAAPIIEVRADFDIGPGLYCPGAMVVLTNRSLSATDYMWSFPGSGIPGTDEVDPVITLPPTEGEVVIQLIAWNDSIQCLDTLLKSLAVEVFVLETLFGDTICQGDTAWIGSLDTIPEFLLVSWTPADLLSRPDSILTHAWPDTTTVYTITLDDGFGCVYTDSVVVVVYEYISTLADWDTLVAIGNTLILPGPIRPGLIYQWQPPDGLSCTSCPNPSYTANDSVQFRLFLADSLGCFERELIFTIRTVSDSVRVPNVFTPNGDGLNDFFNVVVIGGHREHLNWVRIRIYARWGNLIYDNNTPDTGWDGTYKGKACPMDVYAYVIDVGFFDGRSKTLRGDITLVR